MSRSLLNPADAPNDGCRLLRELLLTKSLAQVAKRLACTRQTVGRWAHATRNPEPEWRDELEKIFSIPAAAWARPNALAAKPKG